MKRFLLTAALAASFLCLLPAAADACGLRQRIADRHAARHAGAGSCAGGSCAPAAGAVLSPGECPGGVCPTPTGRPVTGMVQPQPVVAGTWTVAPGYPVTGFGGGVFMGGCVNGRCR